MLFQILGVYPQAEIIAVGRFCGLLFGLCGFAVVKRLFDPRDQLKIGPSGVFWHPYNETIRWSEIDDVTVWRSKQQKAIGLHLRNADRFRG